MDFQKEKKLNNFKLHIVLVLTFLLILSFSGVGYGGADESEIIFSFGLIADIHYGDLPDIPERPRFFRTSLDNVREAVEVFNDEGVDFIVLLGDNIQESGDKETTISFLRTLDDELTKFNGELHYVIGNHDLRDLSRIEFIHNTSGAVDLNYYHFDKKGYRFVILDANYSPHPTVNQSQLNWLEETLEEAKTLDLTVIAFIHQCLDDRGGSSNVNNAEEVREIFESAGNVFASFQGHAHGQGLRQSNA